MPPTLVLRVMVRPVEADEHGGKLVVSEDKVAVSVMAVDEHTHGLERDVEGHTFAFRSGWKVSAKWPDTQEEQESFYRTHGSNGRSTGWGLATNIG
jgi:hypothetical protein